MGAAQGARSGSGVGGLALLDVQAATRFALDARGRILHEGPPELGPAPRVWIAESEEGTAVRLRVDVPSEAVALAAERDLAGLEALLGGEVSRGVTYVVAGVLEPRGEVVLSGTEAGASLLATGLPEVFGPLGFRDEDDLWPPWCVALDGGEPVAIAFSARLSPVGVEAGVFTVPSARGRGFATAATAGWASSPALGSRIRFYSTTVENVSSQRVAARLGLRLVGATVEIA